MDSSSNSALLRNIYQCDSIVSKSRVLSFELTLWSLCIYNSAPRLSTILIGKEHISANFIIWLRDNPAYYLTGTSVVKPNAFNTLYPQLLCLVYTSLTIHLPRVLTLFFYLLQCAGKSAFYNTDNIEKGLDRSNVYSRISS